MQLQAVQTTRTYLQKHRPKRKRDQNSASPLSKASKSVQADLRWEKVSFKLALESADTCTRSKIWWQRIPQFRSSIGARASAYFRSNVWDREQSGTRRTKIARR